MPDERAATCRALLAQARANACRHGVPVRNCVDCRTGTESEDA